MKNFNTVICLLCAIIFSLSINNSFASSKSGVKGTADTVVSSGVIADKVDINSADETILTTLPGIGPKTATRISEYRKVNGPFKSVDDLLNIKGIGPKVLEKLKPFVTVS